MGEDKDNGPEQSRGVENVVHSLGPPGDAKRGIIMTDNIPPSLPMENPEITHKTSATPGGRVAMEIEVLPVGTHTDIPAEVGIQKTEKIEVPRLRENSSKDFRKEVVQRREELVELINDLGFFKARRMANVLAGKYKVSERMIYVDFDWIKGHIIPIDLREIKIDLKMGRSKAFSEAIDILNMAKDDDIKLKAIAMVISAGKHYREEMEAWGEKDKIADRQSINVSGTPAVFNFVEKTLEEIKNARTNNKPEAKGNAESTG